MRSSKMLLAVAFASLTGLAPTCIGIADGALIAVNLTGITGQWDISPSSDPTFGPPADCLTVQPSEYLDSDFGSVENVRIYDIQVQTIGSYGGNVEDGALLVNGEAALGYSGPWSAFSSPQSLLTSALVTHEEAGLAALVQAIQQEQPVTICGSGALSQAITQTDLAVRIEVLGQVDAEP